METKKDQYNVQNASEYNATVSFLCDWEALLIKSQLLFKQKYNYRVIQYISPLKTFQGQWYNKNDKCTHREEHNYFWGITYLLHISPTIDYPIKHNITYFS